MLYEVITAFFRATPVARLSKPASIPRLRQAVAEIARNGGRRGGEA